MILLSWYVVSRVWCVISVGVAFVGTYTRLISENRMLSLANGAAVATSADM